MAEQKSKGLMGLSHYRSSRVSTSLYEPIYQNLFTVQITPPRGLNLAADDEEVLIILEGLRQVGGLDTSKNAGGVKEQKYKMATRSFAGAAPTTTIDITTDWECNLRYNGNQGESYTWKFLRAWNDLVYDPLTGRMGLKRDYAVSSMIVTMHDKAGTPFHQWNLMNVFPTANLTPYVMSYDNDNLYKITGWTLRCDVWDECSI